MIISTRDENHFKQIIGFIPKIKGVSYTPKEFLVWFIKNFNEKDFRVWVDLTDDEMTVKSFVIAQIVQPLIKDEVFIPLSYIKPHSDGAGEELLSRVEGWARTKGIEKISAYINRNGRAFQKKYGFEIGFTEIFKKLDY